MWVQAVWGEEAASAVAVRLCSLRSADTKPCGVDFSTTADERSTSCGAEHIVSHQQLK